MGKRPFRAFFTKSIVHVVEVGGLEALQLGSEVLEEFSPLGVGDDLRLGSRDPEADEAAESDD